MNKIVSSLNIKDERNLSMLMDFYELTMSNGYFLNGMGEKIAYFDMLFRKNPDEGGFSIVIGLEQVVKYIQNLHFSTEDIKYLREQNMFSEEFLDYLACFKFTGSLYAIPEGTVVFPYEPLITVKAKTIDAQLIETMLLLCVNHQTLIGTKASRIVRASEGRGILDMGARRAHGADGAVFGARAAYIAGVEATATTLAGKMFNIPVVGTMAHSWIMMFHSEYEAFATWCKTYPDNALLLVDTYNVLRSGIPNAIKAAKEVLEPIGKRLKGIRLDSGDLSYLSKKVRKMLDEAGLKDCKIVASSSLDEEIITALIDQGASIDSFGVGERLITAKSNPVFGGVYKLVAVENERDIEPKIKLSENEEKITNPGFKQVWRLYDRDTGKAIADVMTMRDEIIDDTVAYEIFHPVYVWKKKKIRNFIAKSLQILVIENGDLVYELPDIKHVRSYCKAQLDTLWEEVKRFENPHEYYVDLSRELWNVKQELIKRHSGEEGNEK